jgi:hypothetical protein
VVEAPLGLFDRTLEQFLYSSAPDPASSPIQAIFGQAFDEILPRKTETLQISDDPFLDSRRP